MNFRGSCALFFFFLLSIKAYSQQNPVLRDTIGEIIIYEYDTVYLKPDTIRLIDTIVNEESKRAKKGWDVKRLLSKTLFSSNSFLAPLTPNSIGFSFSSFNSGSFKERIVDTLVVQPVINKRFATQWNYTRRNSQLSIGIGFTPYHERLKYHSTIFASNPETGIGGQYDSLLIIKDYLFDSYYNYLNLYVLVGRIWKLNSRFSVSLNAGLGVDFLLAYKQGNSLFTTSTNRKVDFSFSIIPELSYRTGSNSEVFLSPFFQNALAKDIKTPLNYLRKTGIGVGFKLILK